MQTCALKEKKRYPGVDAVPQSKQNNLATCSRRRGAEASRPVASSAHIVLVESRTLVSGFEAIMQSTQLGLALLKLRAHLGILCRLTMDRSIVVEKSSVKT